MGVAIVLIHPVPSLVRSKVAGPTSAWHRLREREQGKRFQGLGAGEHPCITENFQRLGEDRKAIKKTIVLDKVLPVQRWSSERPRGDTPCPRSGMVVVRRYTMSKVKETPLRW